MFRDGEPGVPGSLFCDRNSLTASIRWPAGRNASGRSGV